MPVSRTLLLLATLACATCARGGASDGPDLSEQAAANGVEAFLRFGIVDLGKTRAALRTTLGEPDSVTRSRVANLHDPAITDTLVVSHYPALDVEIYVAAYDGRELLASLEIRDDRYLSPESPLRLGMDAGEIRLALGEPDRATDDLLYYECTTCGVGGNDTLELHLERGRLRAIQVQYWID